MSQIQLEESERIKLVELHRGLKNKRSSDRIKAVLMLDDGYGPTEIAKVLLLEEKTIRRWYKRFLNKRNLADYIFTDCRGYDGKLNAEQKEAVSHYVENELISDSKQVRHFIETEFGITFSKSGVIQLLHELGFRYKQTSILPSKMDPKKQSEFKKAYDEFSDNLKEDEALLFVDGMHPVHNLETGKAWIKVGQKKEVLTNSGRQRCNLNGAYNPHTQDLIVKDYRTINTQATIDLFESIEAFYPNKATIFLIVDNAKYYKNDALRFWLKSSKIELIYLPPYSPNLNLIERFWKFLKNQVITNNYYESFSEFKSALLYFCNKASPEHKALLKKSVGTKLHLLKAV